MAIYELAVVPSGKGTAFICPKCKVPGMAALGATDKADLRHMLICPKCSLTLAEWLTLEDRAKELLDVARKIQK